MNESTKIECIACKGEHDTKEAFDRYEIEHGVFAIGLKCPHCNYYIHSYFEDGQLIVLRQSVNRALKVFQQTKQQNHWKEYQRKRDILNKTHDKVKKKYAHLLEAKNG